MTRSLCCPPYFDVMPLSLRLPLIVNLAILRSGEAKKPHTQRPLGVRLSSGSLPKLPMSVILINHVFNTSTMSATSLTR